MDATSTKTHNLHREFGDTDEWPNEVNVHKVERVASLVLGAGLLVLGGIRRGFVGAALAALGGGLVHRGVTGHCHLYGALRISTAHGVRGPSASVPHGQGIKVKRSVTVRAAPEAVYAFWRQLDNLPRFMQHLESVEVLDEQRSRWRVEGPAGQTVEWEAQIINDVEGELIAWRSLPGSEIPNAGSVRFERAVNGHGTIVTVTLEYDPPAGVLGALAAKLLGADPDQQVDEDLHRFKQILEADVPHPDAHWRGRLSEIEDLETARRVLKSDAKLH